MHVYRQLASDWLIYDASQSVTEGLPPVIAMGTGSEVSKVVDPRIWEIVNGATS